MERLDEIFLSAREILDPIEREAFLDNACAGDAALRKRVASMLKDSEGAAAYFGDEEEDSAPFSILLEQAGTVIGRYKLLQKIGEGGMGVVYMAEQREPVIRKVALKIIKLGMDTKQVVARFEAERQALALMDHPNIAKVLDGGATETGRPYFVMELVQGLPITEFCDEAGLPTRERLHLFLDVCSAIQHAHQKGIIHRDLKPSNILVTLHGDKPVPKVIDFGVAKATQGRLTEKTLFTQFQHFIGTPAYMSPEQTSLSGLDVDTRSDIYGLGVLLYELLTGKTPFDGRELVQAGLDEMRRTIREKEPLRPSTRLSTMQGEDLSATAQRRHTEPPKLIYQVKGDLDWIVMKCLEKDRVRRYETANGLAMDIRRHLANETVIARPASALYRLQKTVTRNRLFFAACGAVMGALIIGLSVSLWLLAKETEARQRAVAAEREQKRFREKAEDAQKAETEELLRSHLAVARASRQSGEPGRRLVSLEALAKAAAIRPSLELRNEAIAALALTDLGPPHVFRASAFTTNWALDEKFTFDSDLERYAVGRPDGSISIRRMSDQEELLSLPPVNPEGRTLWFSPDAKTMAVRHHDSVLRLWDLARKVQTLTVTLSGDLPYSVDFTPDSRFVVAGCTRAGSAGAENIVRCFDVATGMESNSLPLALSPVALLFSPSGQVLAINDGNQCQLWNWEQRTLLRTFVNPDGRFTACAWHPDGVRFASGSDKGDIYVWNTLNGKCQDFGRHNYYAAHLIFSPHGDLLASRGWDSTTRLWDAQTGQLMLTSQSGYCHRFSRAGHRLALYRENGEMGFWPVISPRVYRTVNTQVTVAHEQRPVYECDFSPDGRFLLWCQSDGLRWLNIVSGEIGYQELGHAGACSFKPDGTSVISGSDVGLLTWPIERQTNAVNASLRLRQPEPLSTPQTRGRPPFAISQDGQTIVRGGLSSWGIVEANSTERVMKYPNGFQWANHVFISPDKRWVAMGFWGGSAFVLDAMDGNPLKEFTDVRAGIMAFSPDGRWLVTCSGEEYRFWQCGSWQPGLVIKRDLASRASGAIAFTRDGEKMAVARTEYLVQLLDTKSGEVLADLTAPNPQEIHHLSFSPDNTLLAVAGADGMQLWDLRTLRQELAALHLDWPEPSLPVGRPALASIVFHEKLESAVAASPVIPSRPANAPVQLLDLTSFYTSRLDGAWERGNNLALPVGLQTLGGVQYDIRGVIWLGSPASRVQKLEGIPVHQQSRRLHFLHTTAWDLPPGTEIGSYRVHYRDGQRIEIPIIHGRDVRNWWLRKGEGATGEPTAIWTGTNAPASSQGYEVNIFHSCWENPRPNVEILRLDFISASTQCPPCLIAITAE